MTKMSYYILFSLIGAILRWCVALYPYSGQGKPPMYGDYEAQRHWQEITINLPIQEWYVNTTNNDLLYWGLDYPPLTAYHSFVVGKVAQFINPEFVELFHSRGYESPKHKLFMRYTVFIIDLLVYLPAIYYFCKTISVKWGAKSCFIALSVYPGIYLIDYGHFQYNNASLGLFIAAVAALSQDRNVLGSIFFCLALNYKQMELYHALPFFFYLLGICFKEETYTKMFIKLIKIGLAVICTFCIIWYPFIKDISLAPHVLRRIFPIYRGLFEDKVANVWCSLSILIKFKSILNNSNMALICLLVTLISVTPCLIHLFVFPTIRNFKFSLVSAALTFFLFSFHVHEKTILLVTIPACMVIDSELFAVVWFLIIANFSMFPLLIKDNLIYPAIILTFTIYVMLVCILYINGDKSFSKRSHKPFHKTLWNIFYLSMIGAIILTLLNLVCEPPKNLPDLFSVLNATYSCGHFCMFLLYFQYKQFIVPDLSIYSKKVQ